MPTTLSDVPVKLIRSWSRVSRLYIEACDEDLEKYLQYSSPGGTRQ